MGPSVVQLGGQRRRESSPVSNRFAVVVWRRKRQRRGNATCSVAAEKIAAKGDTASWIRRSGSPLQESRKGGRGVRTAACDGRDRRQAHVAHEDRGRDLLPRPARSAVEES